MWTNILLAMPLLTPAVPAVSTGEPEVPPNTPSPSSDAPTAAELPWFPEPDTEPMPVPDPRDEPAEPLGLDLAVRPEAWWDRDGRIFGVPQWLVSATGTVSLRLYDHLTVRTEYRFDHSTAPAGFFYRMSAITDDALGLSRNQHVVLLSLAGHVRHEFALQRK